MILVTNTKTFGESIGVPTAYLVVAYIALAAIWIGAIASAVAAVRRDGRALPQPA